MSCLFFCPILFLYLCPVLNNLSLSSLVNKYDSSEIVRAAIAAFQADQSNKITIEGFLGSVLPILIKFLSVELKRPILLICDDKERANYILNDLESILNEKNVLFFPSSYKQPYQIEETVNANVVLRTETLNAIHQDNSSKVIVTYAEALTEKVVNLSTIKTNTLKIKHGENLGLEFLNEVLFSYQFNRVDFVSEPGEFSIRGGIIDVFSFSNEMPYRISLFGDEVDSIRTFDLETQLSVDKLDQIEIVPNLESFSTISTKQNFLEFIDSETLILFDAVEILANQIDLYFKKAEKTFADLNKTINHAEPKELFLDKDTFVEKLNSFGLIGLANFNQNISFNETIVSPIKPQPSFQKQFDLLLEDLNVHSQLGFTNYLICSNESQVSRLNAVFEDIGKEVRFEAITGSVYQGFIDQDLKILCYTDHQIFERYHKFVARNSFAKKEALTLKELSGLQIGDHVTHIDYGIGKFAGLKKIDNNGQKQEAIKLIYQNNDILYVNIHSLHKIAKYSGKEGVEPKVSKLGSPAWKTLKNKTKAKVKEVAFDLIKLYAKRREQKGFAYQPDTYLQTELEASFIYEDTPDQYRATQEVKADMESDRPMDRLVCGDVGFGKTEVAIRAAFKAATDGKQVAVLVPTTILAYQHFRTFSERLKEMPVNVAYLNRLTTSARKKIILEDLKSGKIDIIIGTHQLVNAVVKYKDLGLLIIDEEHKFGVNVKDKLKTLKENIDTLTLTATPIPRTLQFSLMAARDLSVIKTPPPNRQPVDTYLSGFNEETIRDAVQYEIQRGGQVYIIYNRINSLPEIAGMVQRLVPDARIVTGHGQMEGNKLEDVLLDFIEHKYDVLISTTIIESGLDVPNANTIMIVDAQNFGLADLHQMRGRVGRSNRKAFCYLVTPPVSVLTGDARKRLQAIEQFSDLGSGFNIAMKDLEIRGAGNLLGAEQTGFMMDIGFDTYQKILNEAIEELKDSDDFRDLFPQDQNEEKTYVSDVQIDTDTELLIPDDYVNNTEERLVLYSQLMEIENEMQLNVFERDLKDRFGEFPSEVDGLMASIRLKWVARDLGMEKVVLKIGTLLCYFINQPQSPFYQSDKFVNIMQKVQQNSALCQLKEKKSKVADGLPQLFLRIDGVKSIEAAYKRLQEFL